MEIVFDKEYLEELYKKGKCSDKKHRYQPQIVHKYIRVVDALQYAPSTDALRKFNGLNYEMLRGDKQGLESVRVNNQYRIEFKSELRVDGLSVVTICNIIELSNHYD